MAVYVMSDIHGEYGKYREMLDKIGFSDEDELYIIGDVVDRGSEPVAILLDMMSRPNVFPIMGNHDLLALDVLTKLAEDITEENAQTQIDADTMNELIDWIYNGGEPTLKDFQKLSHSERRDVLDYIREFPLCEVVDVNDRTFVLVHAGLGNFRRGKKLKEYTAEELISTRPDPTVRYFDDDSVYVVMGHTPTPFFTGRAEIYREGNNIFIDCAAHKGGYLACLRLDDLKEFYV